MNVMWIIFPRVWYSAIVTSSALWYSFHTARHYDIHLSVHFGLRLHLYHCYQPRAILTLFCTRQLVATKLFVGLSIAYLWLCWTMIKVQYTQLHIKFLTVEPFPSFCSLFIIYMNPLNFQTAQYNAALHQESMKCSHSILFDFLTWNVLDSNVYKLESLDS